MARGRRGAGEGSIYNERATACGSVVLSSDTTPMGGGVDEFNTARPVAKSPKSSPNSKAMRDRGRSRSRSGSPSVHS